MKYPPEPTAKSQLTRRILAVRRAHEDLFTSGSYVPLLTEGPRSANLIAFERRLGDQRAIVVAPRLVGAIKSDKDWSGTSVMVEGTAEKVNCELTDKPMAIRDGRLNIEAVPLHLFVIG